MAASEIHAPSANFVARMINSTEAVVTSPTMLITWARRMRPRACGSVSERSARFQCRIMPLWLSTNETNTPTM